MRLGQARSDMGSIPNRHFAPPCADEAPATRRTSPETANLLGRGHPCTRNVRTKLSRRDECGTQRLPLRRSPSVGPPAEYNSPRTGVG